jgi:hypothetical protein
MQSQASQLTELNTTATNTDMPYGYLDRRWKRCACSTISTLLISLVPRPLRGLYQLTSLELRDSSPLNDGPCDHPLNIHSTPCPTNFASSHQNVVRGQDNLFESEKFT